MGCWCGYLSGARCRLAYMAQLMPLPLTVSCFRLVLPFWYRLTWVVPVKGQLNVCVCVCLTVMLSMHGTILVLSEKCNLEQCNFCATLTNLQISTIFAVACNFCATSYAYVQFGRALLRPPIIFDRLSMPKIDCLTGKLQSLMCLQPNSVETNSCYSS